MLSPRTTRKMDLFDGSQATFDDSIAVDDSDACNDSDCLVHKKKMPAIANAVPYHLHDAAEGPR